MSKVVFVVADAVELFDLAGPAQAFHEARAAGAAYDVRFAGAAREAAGEPRLTIAKLEPLPDDLGPGDTIVVPGSGTFRSRAESARAARCDVTAWLRRSYERGASVASICVGAFLLGEAGLLDGRRCTTHWRYVEQLAERFRRAEVLANRLYVLEDRVATSAGVAAGLDLALALIDRRCGARLAATVAREMVVSVRRAGEGEQLSATFANRDHLAPDVHLVQDWIVNHPGELWSLDELAAHVGISARTLSRQFKAATGVTVHEYATQLRLEQARTLLADRTLTVDGIAEHCGFSDGRQLRRLWKQHFGMPPSAYRQAAEEV
ncbi:MAG: helix-turn-helix domain-containing protein [Candidatus Eremiobacteraeota bacterium]|nr:helix-turn-helix domain-containing protein [Candidatus Eremiobacteraeota bacterium]